MSARQFVILVTGMIFLHPTLRELPASPYYSFGKNKVQYRQFDWRVMKSSRVDLYYYPEEEDLARVACDIAEDACDRLELVFDHYLLERVSIILYNSHNAFEQTNIIPFLLPESVGGFMEFIKNRIVIPHDGSMRNLEHVLWHELTHLYTFGKLDYTLKIHRKKNSFSPPLWFTEGLAEYLSIGWENQADMILRESVFSGNLVEVKDLWKIQGSFLMYKEGQSLVFYLVETYGEEVIRILLEDWWKVNDFDDLLQRALGFDLDELNERWVTFIQKRYYDDLSRFDPVDHFAERVFSEGYFNGNIATLPPSSGEEDSGIEEIAFATDRAGYMQICHGAIGNVRKGEVTVTPLVKEGQTASFESLHAMRSNMSVNRARKLAFVSKENEYDVLHVLDLNDGKVESNFRFETLVTLSSPDWNPGGDEIVFRGVDYGGTSDIYLFRVQSGKLTNLTCDRYDDQDPIWMTDGRTILYSSDRGETDGRLTYGIWSLDVDTGERAARVAGDYDALQPAVSPDGSSFLFVSDRDGIYRLCIQRIDNGLEATVLDTHHGLFDPEWSKTGEFIYASAYRENRYCIYRFRLPGNLLWETGDRSIEPRLRRPLEADITTIEESYSIRFGFDIVQSIIQFDMNAQSGSGTQVALSDMMGDHNLFFLLGNSALSYDNFWDNINAAFSYADLSHRLNFGIGVFRFTNQYTNFMRVDYYTRRIGSVCVASYPFSKYFRMDMGIIGEEREVDGILSTEREKSFVLTAYSSLVKDTAFRIASDPIDGHRCNISIWNTYNLSSGRFESTSLLFDLRYYYRLARRCGFATRLINRNSFGPNPDLFYMGGSLTFRGYDHYDFIGKNLLLLNTELRFPFLDRLVMDFPPGTMEFWNVRGALFFDAGEAWDDSVDSLAGSFGISFRLLLAYSFVFRLDIAKTTVDFHGISKDTPVKLYVGTSF